ncbi:hypothetical protein CDAR_583171 [Caerostris darwini]|uniref:Uncharacterized protein n=1 Tax=Caerostris darwini TaxID=1538125 RepID=A0AAV4P9A0_9ARAC|nr:hypothetical protein CDAR_583171 [Caerostris darwini]
MIAEYEAVRYISLYPNKDPTYANQGPNPSHLISELIQTLIKQKRRQGKCPLRPTIKLETERENLNGPALNGLFNANETVIRFLEAQFLSSLEIFPPFS